MPYNRPGVSRYVTNQSSGVYLHGQPVKEGNAVGIAVKQKAAHWSDGLAAQNQIQVGEPYLIIAKGVVSIAIGSLTLADGDAVYIDSTNALTKTASGNTKFGRVVELPGDGRGVPAGQARVDLDARDSF